MGATCRHRSEFTGAEGAHSRSGRLFRTTTFRLVSKSSPRLHGITNDSVRAAVQLFSDLANVRRRTDDVRFLEAIGIRALAGAGADRIYYWEGLRLRCLGAGAGLPDHQFHRAGSGANGHLVCVSP